MLQDLYHDYYCVGWRREGEGAAGEPEGASHAPQAEHQQQHHQHHYNHHYRGRHSSDRRR